MAVQLRSETTETIKWMAEQLAGQNSISAQIFHGHHYNSCYTHTYGMIAEAGQAKDGGIMANTGAIDGRVRVAVVDDDEETRLWLKDVLQPRTELAFAGGFSSGKEALTEIPRMRPELVLMDIGLPDLDGIECTKRLRRTMPQLKVVMLSGKCGEKLLDAAIFAGAASFLVKPVGAGQLLAALRFAATKQDAGSRKGGRKDLRLSPRERDVLAGLSDGLLYKEISQKLGISYSAVHKYQQKSSKSFR
jgi:DNA-binding NarL/FixJ family response regulator